MLETNKLYCMDNLELLKSLPSESIDLIYCDILYNTGKKFKDYDDNLGTPQEAMEWYEPRLIEMKRVLKDTGSIYLQCDQNINYLIRNLCNKVFGIENFINEIIWHYKTYQGKAKNFFPRKHDTIFLYSKTNNYTFHLLKDKNYEKTIDFKRWKKYLNENNEIVYGNHPTTDSRFDSYCNKFIKENNRNPKNGDVILKIEGLTVDTVWDIKAVDPKSKERVGYDTQKPKALLERIIKASSNEGDVVADFFMGSGTTCVVAKELGRKYIGCDINSRAIEITNDRLNELEN